MIFGIWHLVFHYLTEKYFVHRPLAIPNLSHPLNHIDYVNNHGMNGWIINKSNYLGVMINAAVKQTSVSKVKTHFREVISQGSHISRFSPYHGGHPIWFKDLVYLNLMGEIYISRPICRKYDIAGRGNMPTL